MISETTRGIVLRCDACGSERPDPAPPRGRRGGSFEAARAAGRLLRGAAAEGWSRSFPKADGDDRRAVRVAPPVDRCGGCGTAP